MKPNTVRAVVVLGLLVVAIAAAFVEARWLRAALVIVPALFLAQRALLGALPSQRVAPAENARPPERDRRSDMTVRRHIRQLLDLIRDFYSTCHMVAVGQLSPSKAKAKAREVEKKLDAMMQDMLERIEEADEGPVESGGGGSARQDQEESE